MRFITTRCVFTALTLIGAAVGFSVACPFLNGDSTQEFLLAILSLVGLVALTVKSLQFTWTFK